MVEYVHGYTEEAGGRLNDQAGALERLIHDGVQYAAGETVLEVGCGVGSQTVTLAARSPETQFTCIDVSDTSLNVARARLADQGTRIQFQRASAFELPYTENTFDHAFVCFVLEHLSDPLAALSEIIRVTRPGGTLTVVEGDHGSVVMHPESEAARNAIGCQVTLQKRAGGDAMIGRRLYPLLVSAGLGKVGTEARQVYTYGGMTELADAFTRKTFTAMIAGVREEAIEARLTTPAEFDQGIEALQNAAGPSGTFAYTFFRGIGRVK